MARDRFKSSNKVLAALPNPAYERMQKHLEPVSLSCGTALHEADAPAKHLIFPTAGIVSLVHVAETGASTEVAVVGSEGVIGFPTFLGGESIPLRAVVQCDGSAARLPASALHAEIKRNGVDLQRQLLRYTQALMTQMAQSAVCNRHHAIDGQLCRWLLMSIDRLPLPQVHMTQQMIAKMLGVRREGVTEAAGKLQEAGLISYSRGRITVLDRAGLEKRACECYGLIKREYARLGFAV